MWVLSEASHTTLEVFCSWLLVVVVHILICATKNTFARALQYALEMVSLLVAGNNSATPKNQSTLTKAGVFELVSMIAINLFQVVVVVDLFCFVIGFAISFGWR
jgi:hypothetical protein